MRRNIHILAAPALPTNLRIELGKLGEVRYWLADQSKGPGRTEHPLLERLWSMEQAFIDSCAPLGHRKREAQRKATAAAAVARTEAAIASDILRALSQVAPTDRHACTRIAMQFDVLPSYVRKLRAKRASL